MSEVKQKAWCFGCVVHDANGKCLVRTDGGTIHFGDAGSLLIKDNGNQIVFVAAAGGWHTAKVIQEPEE